jgi:hypothetical protein
LPGDAIHGVRRACLMAIALAVGACSGAGATASVPTLSVTPTAAATSTHEHGIFVATGPLTQQRAGSGVVLLRDGRVLVVGGWRVQEQLASSEIFDPAAGTWAQTASAGLSGGPTATVLADGRVLVTQSGKSELYDPAVDSFVRSGSMVGGGGFDTATLLKDGRVLFAGGRGAAQPGGTNPAYLASAEIYDPATGEFTRTGSLTTPRQQSQAVRLSDGRVLVVGGNAGNAGDQVHLLAAAELFDPATGKFTPTGSMQNSRSEFTATLLQDGRVLVAGGQGDCSAGACETAEIYDPATGTFTGTGSMEYWRMGHASVLLEDGRVLVVGGAGSQSRDEHAELYDPATGAFSPTGTMHGDQRLYANAIRLNSGRVLVFSNQDAGDGSAEIYWP